MFNLGKKLKKPLMGKLAFGIGSDAKNEASDRSADFEDWDPAQVDDGEPEEGFEKGATASHEDIGEAADLPPVVLRLEENRSGNDYVVGDIHGEFSVLRDRLDEVAFDPDVDRLFSVGDLIDRGPESEFALDWLDQPWFYAVLGNHEEMALDAWHDADTLEWWTGSNGGEWWLKLGEEDQKAFISAFEALPLAIEISTDRGLVGIVHADVPSTMNWQAFTDDLEAGDVRLRKHVLWARSRAMGRSETMRERIDGIERIYCGHTPMKSPTRLGNIYLIDTGACYRGGSLTLASLWA